MNACAFFIYNKYIIIFSDPRIHDDATSIYQYEGETLNTVQGSTSESTGLKLKATVYIHPLGACKYRMQVCQDAIFVVPQIVIFLCVFTQHNCIISRDTIGKYRSGILNEV